jgi:uncharacterized cysteine cluster protein YcgN (CxxCxxCC family)
MTEWWHEKSLDQLDRDEWEALCDGCARCCLHKLEDIDTQEVLYTRIRCRYLDEDACRCSDYANRTVLVPDCIELDPANSRSLDWLPSTCAYRLRANGERLPDWHPLVSGDRDSVHAAGISIRGRCVSEEHVHPDGYDEHVVHWAE